MAAIFFNMAAFQPTWRAIGKQDKEKMNRASSSIMKYKP
jgi:hypothetical protein